MPSALQPVARATGAVLAGIFGPVATLRRSKPLHPKGVVLHGTFRRYGAPTPTGAKWLDEHGQHDCIVRISRAAGVPAPMPDVLGVAVRVRADDEPTDVLLATTGTGAIGRFVLVPRRDLGSNALTTLLPYRGPRGPVMLMARAERLTRDLLGERSEPHATRSDAVLTVVLHHATLTGPWHPFAELELRGQAESEPDPLVRFDPLRNPPPGLANFRWVTELREPAYAAARRGWPSVPEAETAGG